MASPIIPWLPSNIPVEIQSELDRRKTARGLNFVSNTAASWDQKTGDWNKYKGPMSAWARVCSNGLGRPTPETSNFPINSQEFKYPGFIMYSGEEFYSTYGFGGTIKNAIGQSILGYTPKGTPHSLYYDLATSNHPIHVPSPEIVKIEATIQKELYRRVNINWICFSYKQLEYMTPYFLVPGLSVIVEWGWNHFNPNSLLDLTDVNRLVEYWDDPYPLYSDNILLSKGNYDVIFGIITNFEWSIEGNTIKCMTEITSKDRLYSGISTNDVTLNQKKSESEPKEDIEVNHVPDWFTNLKTLCEGNFIQNIVKISQHNGKADTLPLGNSKEKSDELPLGTSGGGADLKALCQRLSDEGRENYWRGIFIGRPAEEGAKTRKGVFKGDFDYTTDTTNNVWVNLGFLVEIMNMCIPIKSVSDKRNSFFQVDVDDCIIGGHPNLISTNGSHLLIPNKIAPKYNHSIISNPGEQYIDDAAYKAKISGVKPKDDNEMWNADYKMSIIFQHGRNPKREDLDKIINANRYKLTSNNNGKNGFEFPFNSELTLSNFVAPKYRYGYFKDLYFNLQSFKDIILSAKNQTTYTDIYEEIFRRISGCVRGYWDLALVEGSSRDGGGVPTMKVVDNRMIPLRNGNDSPYYFNYGEADSVIQSISFKPTLTTAQATRIIFSEQNNKDAKMAMNTDGSLLDYQFKDLILSRNKFVDGPSENVNDNDQDRKASIKQTRSTLQSLNSPPDGSYPMTYNKSNIGKPPPEMVHHVRLVLPNDEFLTMILDDGDDEYNSRYVGIQPNITAEIRLLGIGGLRTFQMFLIRNLPEPYSEKNIVFRIVDIQQEVENSNWITVIRAGIIPLRGSIKRALGIE